MSETNWYNKPYYSLDAYCREKFGHKCYKVALNAHMTCPNRDGTLGTQGCIFCSRGGSGEFAVDLGEVPSGQRTPAAPAFPTDIDVQLRKGIQLIKRKLGGAGGTKSETQTAPYIIAYFQAYTNTYAPVFYLEQIYTQALSHPQVCGISIATRPDCLPKEVLALLGTLKERFPEKFIWVELGLQTIHEDTAALIRRGYDLNCFEQAVTDLRSLGISVIVHIILGLPGETRTQMLETVTYLNRFDIFGIKLQLLHVLEDTDLAELYRQGAFSVLSKEEYLDILIECIEHLSPEVVIHRVTGDGPKRILIAPMWSGNKRDVLNSLHRLMRERNVRQGRLYQS